MHDAKQERRWWAELDELASAKDIAGFWQRYAEYLEWNNVISSNRRIIHKMAFLTVEKLRNDRL